MVTTEQEKCGENGQNPREYWVEAGWR